MLNYFKYFLIYVSGQNVPKKSDKKKIRKENQTRKIYQVFIHNFLCENDKILIKIFEQYQIFIAKCFNTSILYTTDALKVLFNENWFYFFFLIF